MATRSEWLAGETSTGVKLDPRLVANMRQRHATKSTLPTITLEQPKRFTKTSEKPTGGPGTELKGLLAELGIKSRGGCGCNNQAAAMDVLGVEGVRVNREKFRKVLEDGYHASTWWECAKASAVAVKLGLPKTLDGLLDEALRRAEIKLGN